MTDETEENLPEGERRKPGYRELLAQIERDRVDNEARMGRFIKKSYAGFIVIALCCIGALIGFKIIISEIQQNRANFIRDSCIAQNARHKNTVDEINKLVRKEKKKHPKKAASISRNTKSTLLIINALVPHQSCDLLVKVAKGQKKPPPPVPVRPNR